MKVVLFQANHSQKAHQSALVEAAVTTSLQHPHLVHSLTYTIDKLVGTGEVLETPNTANNSPIVMPDDDSVNLYRLQLI